MMMNMDSIEWLNQDRFYSLQKQLNPSLDLLLYSGCLEKILTMWIRKEIVENFREINPSVSSEKADFDILKQWCLEQWGMRLNELFLERKDQLDLVSFRLIRIENQGVALEVYHRLKEKESSFDSLANRFGVLSDQNKDTFRKNKRMGSLPIQLQNKVRTMNPGDLSKPLQTGSDYLIIQVEQFEDAKFTESLKDKILLDQFSSWSLTVVKNIRDRLGSNDM